SPIDQDDAAIDERGVVLCFSGEPTRVLPGRRLGRVPEPRRNVDPNQHADTLDERDDLAAREARRVKPHLIPQVKDLLFAPVRRPADSAATRTARLRQRQVQIAGTYLHTHAHGDPLGPAPVYLRSD